MKSTAPLVATTLLALGCSEGYGSPSPVLLAGAGAQALLGVSSESGEAVRLSSPGLRGFDDVAGLAFDPTTGTLYGVDREAGELLVLDSATRMAEIVAPLGELRLEGLAFDPFAGVLYALDRGLRQLVRIDPATGATTPVGQVAAGLHGLAFDTTAGVLYGVNVRTDRLIALDPATASPTVIGPLGSGLADLSDLAFDPVVRPPWSFCTKSPRASAPSFRSRCSRASSASRP